MLYYQKFEQLINIEYAIKRFSGLTLIPRILVSQLMKK